jgi:insulysin
MAEPLSHSRSAGVERLADKIDKPFLDDRSYRVIKLPNQLEALLIHDADTDKASAAMDVNVGSFSDVKELPGIAHAVEHLLFMGTEKVRRAIVRYSGIGLITISYSTLARTSTTPT